MQNAEALGQEQIREFLRSSSSIDFTGQGRAQIYAWTERVLIAQEFAGQGKKERGLVRAYIGKMTGLSPAQITRLIRSYRDTGSVEARIYHRNRFARQYTDADVVLLAEVDRAHAQLSGPATCRIVKREYQVFGNPQFRASQTCHSAWKVIAGGPVTATILRPAGGPIRPGERVRYEPVECCMLGGTLHEAAGSAVHFEATAEAAIVEVLSPTILRYAAEVDVRTGEVGAIHDTDAVSAKRSLLEAALKSMRASQ